MELTNSQLQDIEFALGKLLASKCRGKLGFRLAQASRMLDPHFKALQDSRQAIAEKYAKRLSSGEMQVEYGEGGIAHAAIAAENVKSANEELRELLAMTVTVQPFPQKLTLEEFDASGIEYDGATILQLGPLVQ